MPYLDQRGLRQGPLALDLMDPQLERIKGFRELSDLGSTHRRLASNLAASREFNPGNAIQALANVRRYRNKYQMNAIDAQCACVAASSGGQDLCGP